MAKRSFTLQSARSGRIRYILLAMVPPLLLIFLLQELMNDGVIPGGAWEWLYSLGSLGLMALLVYLLLLKKRHRIEIEGDTVTEISWRGKEICRFHASRIGSYRRNALKELILLDKNGKRLLKAEANMKNFDRLLKWLEKQDI